VYELRDRFGTYRSVGPYVEMSRGITPIFQTTHIGRSLCREVEEDLQIARLFQHVANYSWKMEQTKIELVRLKLMCKRNEVENQELESKTATTQ
jgi:hypothetical protein